MAVSLPALAPERANQGVLVSDDQSPLGTQLPWASAVRAPTPAFVHNQGQRDNNICAVHSCCHLLSRIYHVSVSASTVQTIARALRTWMLQSQGEQGEHMQVTEAFQVSFGYLCPQRGDCPPPRPDPSQPALSHLRFSKEAFLATHGEREGNLNC